LASESGLSVEDITVLCEAYWKKNISVKVARALAWSMIARYGWMMWASIQSAVSTIDFDFKTWGLKKWNSVLPDLNSENYKSVLATLKQTY
ncbi:MAG TPA: hypothetical protein VKI61_16860, partial [Chitinophagaceae bacterium]|nr:hypothetical protein [Chitinophagaceae bacterium]